MIKVKSVSDVITNSSSEVFVIKSGKALEFYKEKLREENLNPNFLLDLVIETEEDLKNFLFSDNNYGEWRFGKSSDNQVHEGPDINPEVDFFGYHSEVLDYLRDVKGYTNDKIWELIKDSYKSCIGYAFIEFGNEGMDGDTIKKIENCYYKTEEFQDIYYNGYKPGDKDVPVEIIYQYYDENTKKIEEQSVILKSYITDDWKKVTPTEQPGVPDILKDDKKYFIKSIKIKKDDKSKRD